VERFIRTITRLYVAYLGSQESGRRKDLATVVLVCLLRCAERHGEVYTEYGHTDCIVPYGANAVNAGIGRRKGFPTKASRKYTEDSSSSKLLF
jgi:hypothetical protein